MSKTYLPYDPDQQLLLPAALQEWLPEDHLAYFIFDVVDQLDLSDITARYEQERRGGPPYHPRMMVKALLYGYCTGVASSRRIAQRLHEDIAFRVLAANNTPDFRTVSDFRKDHLEALGNLFLQVLALCQQAGLVKLGHVALDGTKVRANASKHKAMSYGRMKEREERSQAVVTASPKVISAVPPGCTVTFQFLVELAVRCATAVTVAPVATSAWSCNVVAVRDTSSLKETRSMNSSAPLWDAGISEKYAVGGASGRLVDASVSSAAVMLTLTVAPTANSSVSVCHQ